MRAYWRLLAVIRVGPGSGRANSPSLDWRVLGAHAQDSHLRVTRESSLPSATRAPESNAASVRATVGDGDSTDEERRFLERCRLSHDPAHQRSSLAHRGGYPVLGLAQTHRRLRLRSGGSVGATALVAVRADRRSIDHRRLVG